MKRTILFVMLVSCAIALLSAQGYSDGQGQRQDQRQRRNPEGQLQLQRRQPENVSVSGNLSIVRGMIAVTDGGTTYIVGGLNRFVGFIDGLREGSAVTLEGSAFPVPQDESVKFLSVQKMTLNGKEYDLGRPAPNFQNQRPHPMHQRPMPRRGYPMHHRPMPRHMPQKMHRR